MEKILLQGKGRKDRSHYKNRKAYDTDQSRQDPEHSSDSITQHLAVIQITFCDQLPADQKENFYSDGGHRLSQKHADRDSHQMTHMSQDHHHSRHKPDDIKIIFSAV